MIIKELMDKLVSEMEPSASDFEQRLGRDKPEVKSIEIQGIIPEQGEDEPEDDMMDEADVEMSELDEMPMEDESPEEKLKKRLMKLRG